jgi:hypothetical protein
VPVKCFGPVAKGDLMVAYGDGLAKTQAPDDISTSVFGVALENYSEQGIGLVECVVL